MIKVYYSSENVDEARDVDALVKTIRNAGFTVEVFDRFALDIDQLVACGTAYAVEVPVTVVGKTRIESRVPKASEVFRALAEEEDAN